MWCQFLCGVNFYVWCHFYVWCYVWCFCVSIFVMSILVFVWCQFCNFKMLSKMSFVHFSALQFVHLPFLAHSPGYISWVWKVGRLNLWLVVVPTSTTLTSPLLMCPTGKVLLFFVQHAKRSQNSVLIAFRYSLLKNYWLLPYCFPFKTINLWHSSERQNTWKWRELERLHLLQCSTPHHQSLASKT